MTWRAKWVAYGGCARMQFSSFWTYRADSLIGTASLFLKVYLLSVVWTAVYDGRDTVGGVGLDTMVTYSTLAFVQFMLVTPFRFSPFSYRIREGMIAVDLLRPVGVPGQMIAIQVGGIAAAAPFVLAVVPFAVLVIGAEPPASFAAAMACLVSLILAFAVAQLLTVLIGMVAFWTLETTGIFMVYRFVAQLLSGALVPLAFMPEALRTLAELLPFQATTYTPIAAYLGQLTGAGLTRALALQAVWIAVLALVAKLVWARAVRRVVVQGG